MNGQLILEKRNNMNFRKIELTILFVIICNCVYAQINDYPSYPSIVLFEEGRYEPNDTIPRQRFRTSGMPHILYEKTVDGIIIRKEFFKNGALKSIVEITQVISADTSIYYDFESKQHQIAIVKTLFDVPNGEYTAYNLNARGLIKSQGNCKNARRIGIWTFYDRHKNKTIVTYNDKGEPDGLYEEYYYSRKKDTYQLKIKGQFGIQQFKTKHTSSKTGEIRSSTKTESRRIGRWEYYATDGNLLEVVEYKWVYDLKD